MKNTLRIIINRYFRAKNTRCSSTAVRSKLPLWAMVGYESTPRILVKTTINDLVFVSNFNNHSLSANSLYSPKESAVDKVTGVVSVVCLLAIAFIALGV